jgi:hypothetical protein
MADDPLNPRAQQMLAYLRRIWPQWETATRLAHEAGLSPADGHQHIDALLAAKMIERLDRADDEGQYRALRES